MSGGAQTEADIRETNLLYLPEEEAVKETLKRMKSAERHTIWFLSEEDAAYCSREEEGADYLASCDLILSGTDQIDPESAMEAGEERLSFDIEKYTINYLRELLSYLNEDRKTIYLVMKSETAGKTIIDYLDEHAPDLDHHLGIITEEAQADAIVNDINAVLPDIAIFSLPADAQIRFMREYYSMMNTRICICMNSLEQIVGTDEVPELIRKLHLTGIYQWIQKGKTGIRSGDS